MYIQDCPRHPLLLGYAHLHDALARKTKLLPVLLSCAFEAGPPSEVLLCYLTGNTAECDFGYMPSFEDPNPDRICSRDGTFTGRFMTASVWSCPFLLWPGTGHCIVLASSSRICNAGAYSAFQYRAMQLPRPRVLGPQPAAPVLSLSVCCSCM